MLFDSATCRTSRLCFPASLKTWTTYLPSGEMAARVALPLEVNLRTCIDWNGGAAPISVRESGKGRSRKRRAVSATARRIEAF